MVKMKRYRGMSLLVEENESWTGGGMLNGSRWYGRVKGRDIRLMNLFVEEDESWLLLFFIVI